MITRAEFDIVKTFKYKDYCEYLIVKHGAVQYKYGSKRNKKPGLFIHHIKEDTIPSLSHKDMKKLYPEYQEPEYLCYCDYLEHLLLHIMIGREADPTQNLGLNGPCTYMIPALLNYYRAGRTHPKWPIDYYIGLDEAKDIFDEMLTEYNELVSSIDVAVEHNNALYPQVADALDKVGKACAVLGTGLGKTPLALRYINERKYNALIVCPNDTVKESWAEKKTPTTQVTFQTLGKKFNEVTDTLDYDLTAFDIIVIDEVHHAGYDEEKDTGAVVWGKAINALFASGKKVLGLTATPVRSDGIDVAEQFFTKEYTFEGYSFEKAIEDGIVHPISYITSVYDKTGITKELDDLGFKDTTDPAYMKLRGQLDLTIQEIPDTASILTTHTADHEHIKGLVYVQEVSKMDDAIAILKEAFPAIRIEKLYSDMSKTDKDTVRDWFIKCEDGLLVVVNMINEGAHYPNVNVGIIFRTTQSYLLFTQIIGRFSILASKPNPNIVFFDLVNNINRIQYKGRVKKKDRISSTSITKAIINTDAAMSGQVIVKDYTQNFVERMYKLKEYVDDAWEDWEIEILQKYYINEGAKRCRTKLAVAHEERFPESVITVDYKFRGYPRTINAIIREANKLGLFRKSDSWEDSEDDVLKTYYPVEGMFTTAYFTAD